MRGYVARVLVAVSIGLSASSVAASDESLIAVADRYARLVDSVNSVEARSLPSPRVRAEPGVRLNRRPLRYLQIAQQAADRYQLHVSLVLAVIAAESAGDPRAQSTAGARGLMQILPSTGRDFFAEPAELFVPERNIEVGSAYLRFLLSRYSGHVDSTLQAWNFGIGNLEKGRPIPKETRDFVQRVRRYYRLYHEELHR